MERSTIFSGIIHYFYWKITILNGKIHYFYGHFLFKVIVPNYR